MLQKYSVFTLSQKHGNQFSFWGAAVIFCLSVAPKDITQRISKKNPKPHNSQQVATDYLKKEKKKKEGKAFKGKEGGSFTQHTL